MTGTHTDRTSVSTAILRLAMAAALLLSHISVSYAAASSLLTPTWFITDHIGSVRSVISNDGTILQQNDYYPYGERHGNAHLTAGSNRWQFSGKENQQALGYNAYDFGARFYNHLQWTTMDPMAQKYYGLSPYAYCAGDPVNLVDPEGLEKIKAVQNPNISSAADNFPENEGVIHIWAHGNSNAIKIENDKEDPYFITNINDLIAFLENNSVQWKEDKMKGEASIIVLHSCKAGKGNNSIAQKFSSELPEDIIVAADELVVISPKGQDYQEMGSAQIDTNYRIKKYMNWLIFKGGKQVDAFPGYSKPIFKHPKEIIKKYDKIHK